VPLGRADHVIGDESQQPAEYKGDSRNHQQVRQLDANELLGIDDPLVQHTTQKPALGKPARPCRQQ